MKGSTSTHSVPGPFTSSRRQRRGRSVYFYRDGAIDHPFRRSCASITLNLYGQGRYDDQFVVTQKPSSLSFELASSLVCYDCCSHH